MRYFIFALLVILASFRAEAQVDSPTLAAKYIPDTTDVMITFRPRAIMALPALEYLPTEVASAYFEESFGIGFQNINRIDILLRTFPPANAMVITTNKAVDVNEIEPSVFRDTEWSEDDGIKSRGIKADRSQTMYRIDDSHFVIGMPEFCKEILELENKEGPLSNIASRIKGSPLASFVYVLEPSREFLLQQLGGNGAVFGSPELAEHVPVLIELVNHVAVRWVDGESNKLQIVITAEEGESIDEVQDSLVAMLEYFETQYRQLGQLMVMGNPTYAESLDEYLVRLHDGYAKLLTPRKSNNRMLIEAQIDDPLLTSSVAALVGLSAGVMPMQMMQGAPMVGVAGQPFVDEAQNDPRIQSLLQIGLAIHNFESAYKKLPANIVSEDDQPLLSWRVGILPFLGYNELYHQFHLDEPWDSEHNITLIEQMPDIFRFPGVETQPGYTPLLGISGPQLAFEEDRQLALRDYTDGLSNTTWTTIVDAENAKPWTAPQDFEPEADDPAKGLYLDEDNQNYVLVLEMVRCAGFRPIMWMSFGRCSLETAAKWWTYRNNDWTSHSIPKG